MSHVGPLARSAADAALFVAAVAGPDERDVYSLPAQQDAAATVFGQRLRIGWSPDLGFMPVEPEIRARCEKAVQLFTDAGCDVLPLDLALDDPRGHAAVFFEAGAAMAVSGFPNWRERITPGLVPVVERGLARTGVEFAAAQMARARLAAALAPWFEKVDLIATPATPVAAFDAALDGPERIANTPSDPFDWMGLTLVFNMVGAPAASVPCGFTAAGLPVGLQIAGPRFADARVLHASRLFEAQAGPGASRPALADA
jgi:aspartyl-tRNA(Asn)/glutamyl-tRNA(Gln) amidotransferase subunit A